jgi:saccharopine dehydrogenase (NAD+, L-lysine-forming)
MPALDLIAIDHLPSLLPRESSEDFSTQMLPYLSGLNQLDQGVWARAEKVYQQHLSRTRDDTAPAH